MAGDVSKLIRYSEKYNDSHYEYRHVTLPEAISKKVSKYIWRAGDHRSPLASKYWTGCGTVGGGLVGGWRAN